MGKSSKERLLLVEPTHSDISIVRQCELLDISRSSYYYEPLPESSENIAFMRQIDEIYTKFPYYGSPRITAELQRRGFSVNHKRIERLMRIMGIEAIYPKHNTSKSDAAHMTYPYLLRNVTADHPNHIWGTDITYIRACGMWFYLVALLDWFSRYVLAWQLSETLELPFCLENLERALMVNKPDIHNSDQGSHFTSSQYTAILTSNNIQISMDGRGRCMDNIFTERLWRTVKYEEVYLHDYQSYEEAHTSLHTYFQTYNYERLHQALQYKTPAEIYFQ